MAMKNKNAPAWFFMLEQDFEDWDDVGLNMARPPSLLHLYKDYGNHATPVMSTEDFHCQVELEREEDQKLWEEWNDLKSQLVSSVWFKMPTFLTMIYVLYLWFTKEYSNNPRSFGYGHIIMLLLIWPWSLNRFNYNSILLKINIDPNIHKRNNVQPM